MLRDTRWLWCGFTQQLDKRQSMTQRFNHNSPWIFSFCLTPHTQTLQYAQNYSMVSFLSSLLTSPQFIPQSGCKANAADYILMFGLGASVVPPAGSMTEICPLCVQLEWIIITDAGVSTGAASWYTWAWVREAGGGKGQLICSLEQKKQLSYPSVFVCLWGNADKTIKT